MAAWVVYGAFFLTGSAQNGTNETDISQCGSFNTLSPDAHVNSSGSISFTWEDGDEAWHLTTTFNDTRAPVLIEGIQDFGTWVSVPGDTDTSICTYRLRPMNATGTGDNGCEGVLSQQCVDWLTNNIKYDIRDDGSEKKCARSPYHDDVAKNCGQGVVFEAQIGQSYLQIIAVASINNPQVDSTTCPTILAPFLHPQGMICRMDTEHMRCSEWVRQEATQIDSSMTLISMTYMSGKQDHG
jgi:hypothetical protein